MQENKQDKYEFISEKIKEKPVNKKKLVYHVCFVVLLAVLFGIVASVTFVLCQPKMDDLLHPKEDPTITIPKDEPEQETESGGTLGYTPVASDLYYSGGYLGTLKIPAIGLSVRVYEGTDSSTLMKGAGHFKGTSIWDGNCAIAGHNRGVRDDFGDLHTLERGDTITWTTKLGVRTYEVTSVEKVKETDTSGTAPSTENMLTLYTCVRNQRDYRWQVQAVEGV